MQTLITLGSFFMANWQILIAGVCGLLSSLIVVALVIPGPQPEKALQSILDFLSKFSKK